MVDTIRLSAKPQLHLKVTCSAAVRRPLIFFLPFACADHDNRTNSSQDLSIYYVYLYKLFLAITSICYNILFLSAAY